MSKKLAEGIDALVLDVKTGNGAFMQTYEDSVESCPGSGLDRKDHGQRRPSPSSRGWTSRSAWRSGTGARSSNRWNACAERTVPDLMEVTYVLGGAMLFLGGKASSIEEGMKTCESAIWSGRAYEKFLELVRVQGGEVSYIENPGKYPEGRRLSFPSKARQQVISPRFDNAADRGSCDGAGSGQDEAWMMRSTRRREFSSRRKSETASRRGRCWPLIQTDRSSPGAGRGKRG